MKTLEAKPFDQNVENWKQENRLFTSTVLAAGASGQNRIGTHAQCCQVPVFVRIFTEIRPVIRSTEMQWSIPQIWKKPISKSFNLKQVSVSNWLRTMPGDRSVNQLAADQHLATRYYLKLDTTLVAWHALSEVRVQFGGLWLVFNDHVRATKFPTAQEEGEKSWSFLVFMAFTAWNFVVKKKKVRILPCALVAPLTSPLTMAASTT